MLVYRGSGVLNFAHGAIGMVGAFYFYNARRVGHADLAGVHARARYWAAVIGVAIHLLIMRPLRRAPALSRLIATLGLFTAFYAFALNRYGINIRIITKLIEPTAVEVLPDISIGRDRIVLLIIGVALTIVLTVVYRHTRFGYATTAVAESRRATAAQGISPDRIAAINWAIGTMLGVLAAILIVNLSGLQVITLTLLDRAGAGRRARRRLQVVLAHALRRPARSGSCSRRSRTCRCSWVPTPICRAGRRRFRSSSSSSCSSCAGARCRCAATRSSDHLRSALVARSGSSSVPAVIAVVALVIFVFTNDVLNSLTTTVRGRGDRALARRGDGLRGPALARAVRPRRDGGVDRGQARRRPRLPVRARAARRSAGRDPGRRGGRPPRAAHPRREPRGRDARPRARDRIARSSTTRSAAAASSVCRSANRRSSASTSMPSSTPSGTRSSRSLAFCVLALLVANLRRSRAGRRLDRGAYQRARRRRARDRGVRRQALRVRALRRHRGRRRCAHRVPATDRRLLSHVLDLPVDLRGRVRGDRRHRLRRRRAHRRCRRPRQPRDHAVRQHLERRPGGTGRAGHPPHRRAHHAAERARQPAPAQPAHRTNEAEAGPVAGRGERRRDRARRADDARRSRRVGALRRCPSGRRRVGRRCARARWSGSSGRTARARPR